MLSVACGLLFLHYAYQTLTLSYPVSASTPVLSTSDPDTAVKAITAAALFKGGENSDIPGAATAISGIKVKGIFAGALNASSYVIIAVPGQPDKSYRVGDSVTNGLHIAAIQVDRVVISDDTSKTELFLRESP